MAAEVHGNVFNQFLLPLMVRTLSNNFIVFSSFRIVSPFKSGSIAGTTGDIVMFPLDTIKTRLQSKKGFLAAGGFRNIYSGILPAAISSAPSGKD